MPLSVRNARKNGVPWYIIVESLVPPLVITSRVIPGAISDSTPVIYAEVPVPGLDYTPLNPMRIGNNKLAFSVPIINRQKTKGNQEILNQIELLRQTQKSLADLLSLNRGINFSGPPKVLYGWGTHRAFPLQYLVRKADFNHNAPMPPNKLGYSRYTVVDFELEIDGTSPLFTAWQKEIRVAAAAGLSSSAYDIFGSKGTL